MSVSDAGQHFEDRTRWHFKREAPERTHTLAFFPAASDAVHDGLARVMNHSAEAGEVRIEAFDDEGESHGPVVLSLDGGETVHFSSEDLEGGNAARGLSGGVGSGRGDWRLQLSSRLDIEVLSYVRGAGGFLAAMHDTVPSEGGRHRVAFFNPGSNAARRSVLRLVNPGEEVAEVSIAGVDDQGASSEGEVRLRVPARAAKRLSAQELEAGGEGMDGALGDGAGKWRLTVESAQPIIAMSLLRSAAGQLTNLSTAPANEVDGVHFVPLLPAASDASGQRGFVRVINRSEVAGEVSIEAFDDAGAGSGALVLSMEANGAVQFSAENLERGNGVKGLSGRTGEGEGAWRLEVGSDLDIRVLSYVRSPDGILAAMHDTVPSEGGRHHVAFFNPGSNAAKRSLLRLVNPGDEVAEVSIVGVDGQGDSSEGEVRVRVPARAAKWLSAQELEAGGEGMDGALGDGAGKWRLTVESAQPLIAMSLLSDPAGRLSNLSTAPGRASQGRPALMVVSSSVSNGNPVTGATFTLSATVRNDGDTPSPGTALRYYRSSDAEITTTDRAVDTVALAGLGASGSVSASVELTAPSTPGKYYYGACVDAVAEEIDATNNCSTAVEVNVQESEYESGGHPDLIVAPATVSDSAPSAGATFTLSVTVNNAGDGTGPAAVLRYYRSSDVTITTSDTPVGADEVAELGASGSSSKSVELTAPSTPGTYHYGACVDAVTGESDTTNNCSASVKVEVEEPPQYPDLRVETPTVNDASPETGATFTLAATVTNAGDAEAAATTLRYYRSTDATITTSDTAVGTDAVGALSASGTSDESIDLTAPSTAGAVYYGACVDAVTDESDTTDNCSTSVKVDVEAPQPSTLSVEVTAPQEWAPVGDTVTYTASVQDGEGTEMSGYTFSWSSSDTSKATVDSSGVVTAVAVGEATITATASATTSSMVKTQPLARDSGALALNSESTLSGTLPMDVVKPVARIELSPSSLSFDATSEVETVTANLYDSDDDEMSATYSVWYSADNEVAEAYPKHGTGESAYVKSIGDGSTTVSLNANGTTQSMDVTVTLPTARVDISPRSLTFEALGNAKSVTVKVLDENGDEDEDATWNYIGISSACCGPNVDPTDRRVMTMKTVDGGIEVTSKSPGTGQIYISSTGVEQAILGVTVRMKPASVGVSPSSPNLEVDGTTTLTATVADSNGNSIHVNQNDGRGGLVVYWETSDSTVATVEGSDATENHNTGATATVTAVGAGSATITARHGVGTGRVSNTATITVTDGN